MPVTSDNTFDVADQTPESASITVVVQPPIGFGDGEVEGLGRGQIIHPTLGTYDYVNTPDETVNVDGNVMFGPQWAHTQTLTSGIDAFWSGNIRDAVVIERWIHGDSGPPIALLRALYSFFANPPEDPAANPVIWNPNYANTRSFEVAIVAVRSGGQEYRLDRRLLSYGLATNPVELELRVIRER